ncbi:MAG: hypothetical protein C4326_01865 [Ignavibacteria bacterium]
MQRTFTLVLLILVASTELYAQGSVPPPTNLTAQAVSGNHPRVYLSWTNSQGTWYCNLYRSVNDTLHFVRIAQVPGRTFEDRGVMGGRTYYYYVRAVAWRDSTLIESPRSSIAGASLSPVSGLRGTIQGSILDDSTGTPIRGVRVRFFRFATIWADEYDITDSLGRYEAALDTGRYLVKAEPPCEPITGSRYRAEWFDNVFEPSTATPVAVGGGTTSTANFRLGRFLTQPHAEVNGVVSNEQGQPLANATVAIMRSIQEMHRLAALTGTTPGLGVEARELPGIGYTRGVIWSGTTDNQGRFRAVVPQNGSYIAAAGKPGYLLQYFSQTTDPTRAVIITAREDTSGVNFFLRQVPPFPHTIDGIIRDTTGEPVPSRVILFPRPPGGVPPVQVTHSNVGGAYTFTNVADGSYVVLALPYGNYGAAFYKEGAFGVAQWQLADSVLVGAGNATAHVGVLPIRTTGVTQVSGSALSSTGEPLAGARIVARSQSGILVGTTFTTSTGAYSLDALPFGDLTFVVDREPYNGQFMPLSIPPNTYMLSNINVVLTRSNVTGSTTQRERPLEFTLKQNYPNPFNPSTLISFSLPAVQMGGRGSVFVTLKVFDVLGQEVAVVLDEERAPGRHVVLFTAEQLASGVYYYRLDAGPFTAVRKMLLMR